MCLSELLLGVTPHSGLFAPSELLLGVSPRSGLFSAMFIVLTISGKGVQWAHRTRLVSNFTGPLQFFPLCSLTRNAILCMSSVRIYVYTCMCA